jgi:hypothetical protein
MNKQQVKELAFGKLRNEMELEKRAVMSRWGVDSDMASKATYGSLFGEELTELESKLVNGAKADIESVERKYAKLMQEVANS